MRCAGRSAELSIHVCREEGCWIHSFICAQGQSVRWPRLHIATEAPPQTVTRGTSNAFDSACVSAGPPPPLLSPHSRLSRQTWSGRRGAAAARRPSPAARASPWTSPAGAREPWLR
eukprot:6181789-Pleurochrysis_carterae.AAC.3